MIDVKFRGRRMIVSCLNCGHEQMGYSKIDGNRCDQCGDGPLEIKRWLDEEEPKKGTMLGSCLNCGHEQMGYSKIDGNRCDQCGDGPLEIKRWLDEEEPKKGTMLCSECEKLNIAMQLLKGLSWKDSR